MIVSDAMTKDPITIDPEAPLGTAVDVMRTNKLRHLPVVDDAGQLVGIITDRDLRHAVLAPAFEEYLSASGQRRFHRLGQTLEDLRVRDMMTWGVVATHPAAPLAHAALIMFERHVGCLPVVTEGRLEGILTEHDILQALASGKSVRHFNIDGFLW
jgi:acetoin utilization protein AcuB